MQNKLEISPLVKIGQLSSHHVPDVNQSSAGALWREEGETNRPYH